MLGEFNILLGLALWNRQVGRVCDGTAHVRGSATGPLHPRLRWVSWRNGQIRRSSCLAALSSLQSLCPCWLLAQVVLPCQGAD